MGNIFNDDFRDFINALEQAEVEYILIGGYAVIFHGYNRTTGDLGIWVNPTAENYQSLKMAFSIFGMSLFNMTEENFLDTNRNEVFSFGKPPVCIDILTSVKGLEFDKVYKNAKPTKFDELKLRIIDINDLIIAKKAADRNKDKDDLDHLV
ncbi:MAG: nucleotidyltransferase [Chitinophagales bacterium]